jgi:hypothetical protein
MAAGTLDDPDPAVVESARLALLEAPRRCAALGQ